MTTQMFKNKSSLLVSLGIITTTKIFIHLGFHFLNILGWIGILTFYQVEYIT